MESLKENFLKMLSQYQGILHKVCLIYFRNEDDRKDNFQEIVYQMWRSYPKLRDKDRFVSWIYTISINTSISRIRKDSRIDFRETVPEPLGYIDSDKQMDADEDLQILLQAVHNLNEIDKSIILLYLEERSYEEIAEILGFTVSNVGTRIGRAKAKLKQIFKEREL